MYTFSSKLKTFSFILMAVGLLGIGFGFYNAPKDIQAVEKLLAADAHGSSHGAAQAVEAHAPANENHAATQVVNDTAKVEASNEATNTETVVNDSVEAPAVVAPVHAEAEMHAGTEENKVNAEAEHAEHLEHVLHQLQNKPWAALYVACIFFLLVTLGVLAFYAIQQVAQAGWSPVLFRVMQG
ncbi:MAG TPA: quinol:cytochrome C oxidoreductase, partial [Flavobacterium sp.]|nr:quinol:cytochrome C oxidoreductase [Flavobacterium sp.]